MRLKPWYAPLVILNNQERTIYCSAVWLLFFALLVMLVLHSSLQVCWVNNPSFLFSRDECCSVGLFLIFETGNLCRVVVCLSSAWKGMPILLRGDSGCFGKVISQCMPQCCKNSAIIWDRWCQLGHSSTSMLCNLGLQKLNIKLKNGLHHFYEQKR